MFFLLLLLRGLRIYRWGFGVGLRPTTPSSTHIKIKEVTRTSRLLLSLLWWRTCSEAAGSTHFLQKAFRFFIWLVLWTLVNVQKNSVFRLTLHLKCLRRRSFCWAHRIIGLYLSGRSTAPAKVKEVIHLCGRVSGSWSRPNLTKIKCLWLISWIKLANIAEVEHIVHVLSLLLRFLILSVMPLLLGVGHLLILLPTDIIRSLLIGNLQ